MINFEFQPKQLEALAQLADFPIVGYGGAKGGGKSYLGRSWQILRRDKYPNTHGLILRKTYPELYNTHIKKILEEHPDLRKYYNESKKMFSFPNGSTLTFGYLQRTQDVYQYQGVEYEDIFLDEATQHAEEVVKILRTSLRTNKYYIKPKLLLTFNPGGIGHAWVKRLFIDRKFNENEDPNDYAFVQAKVHDNQVLLNANPEYLKTLQSLDEKTRMAYLEGSWDVFEGMFFTEWNESKHVVKPKYELKDIPENFPMYLSWDEGTFAPRAVYLLVQNNDGQVDIVWEHYKAGQTAVDAAYAIQAALKDKGVLEKLQKYAYLVYDPSMDIKSNQTGLSTSEVVGNILGIKLRPGNNNRIEGARRFRDFLTWNQFQEPLFHVWDTCENFIRTFPGLIHDKHAKEDIDSDSEDHAYDSVRYGLMECARISARMNPRSVSTMKPIISGYKPMGG